MINIDIESSFVYYNGTNETHSLNLNFKRFDDNTLKCDNQNLTLKLDKNSLTIKKEDDLSYTKTFSLNNETISLLTLNNMTVHTKIHTTKFITNNNVININATEYSMNDEVLAQININLNIKENKNG